MAKKPDQKVKGYNRSQSFASVFPRFVEKGTFMLDDLVEALDKDYCKKTGKDSSMRASTNRAKSGLAFASAYGYKVETKTTTVCTVTEKEDD